MRNNKLVLLFCLLTPAVINAQDFKGRVFDKETSEAIPSANVLLVELNKGSATNLNGEFEIKAVPEGEYTLQISFIGFKTFKRKITITQDRYQQDFYIEPDLSLLEEVVVTGYTTQGRNRLTGAISQIQAEAVELMPMASFDQILQGQSPGLFVSSGSGQPGAASTVRIRGRASINGGSSPLYIVDGIPITGEDFATLNPADFEDYNVLKDASSTAEYGSRGTNGVIVITTKRGKAGKTLINYQSQYGFSDVGRFPFSMMDTSEKLEFEEKIQSGPGWSLSQNNPSYSSLTPQEQAEVEDQLANLRSIDTNWKDVFFRRGITSTNEVNFSGGNERTRYYLSTNIFNQEGVGERSSLDRYTLRSNIDFQANEDFDVGLSLQTGYSEASFIESEGGVALANPYAAVYLANPYEPLFDEDGSISTGAGPQNTGANAYERLERSLDGQNELKILGNVYAKYRLGSIQFGASVGMDYSQREFNRYVDPLSFAGIQEQNGGAGRLQKEFDRLVRVTSLVSAEWQKTLNEVHDISLFAANELITTRTNGFEFTGFGLNPKLPNTPAGVTQGTDQPDDSDDPSFIPTIDGFITENALWSQFLIANYSFQQKYNLKATIRRDGSSRFGSENKFALLWALGGSWVMSEETFLDDIEVLDRLSLRSSYGITGNQNGIGNFQWRSAFNSLDYAGAQAIIPAQIGNPNLQWETAKKFNVGMDFDLLSNRISGSFDYYNELTENLFIEQQLSRTSGFRELEINAGTMRNTGFELQLAAEVIRRKNLGLTLRANVANNINEIVDLGQVNEFFLGSTFVREGLSIESHFEVAYAGVDPATGDNLFYDLDGNVTTDFDPANAVANFGSSLPPWFGGFGVDANVGPFSIRTQFNFAQGYNRFNNQLFFLQNVNFSQYNQMDIMNTIWTQPGDITSIPGRQFNREFSSRDIEDASFLRFRNLLVSYNIPGSVFDGVASIRGIRLFAQAQNLYTWTKWTGFDPEDSNQIATFEYPLPRTFTFGVDLKF